MKYMFEKSYFFLYKHILVILIIFIKAVSCTNYSKNYRKNYHKNSSKKHSKNYSNNYSKMIKHYKSTTDVL